MTVFAGVTVPAPHATLRAVARSTCGHAEDAAEIDVIAGSGCDLALTPTPQAAAAYPTGVLNAAIDPDPTPGFQAQLAVTTRFGLHRRAAREPGPRRAVDRAGDRRQDGGRALRADARRRAGVVPRRVPRPRRRSSCRRGRRACTSTSRRPRATSRRRIRTSTITPDMDQGRQPRERHPARALGADRRRRRHGRAGAARGGLGRRRDHDPAGGRRSAGLRDGDRDARAAHDAGDVRSGAPGARSRRQRVRVVAHVRRGLQRLLDRHRVAVGAGHLRRRRLRRERVAGRRADLGGGACTRPHRHRDVRADPALGRGAGERPGRPARGPVRDLAVRGADAVHVPRVDVHRRADAGVGDRSRSTTWARWSRSPWCSRRSRAAR